MAHEVVIAEERIESAILLLRGHGVMLSSSLAVDATAVVNPHAGRLF